MLYRHLLIAGLLLGTPIVWLLSRSDRPDLQQGPSTVAAFLDGYLSGFSSAKHLEKLTLTELTSDEVMQDLTPDVVFAPFLFDATEISAVVRERTRKYESLSQVEEIDELADSWRREICTISGSRRFLLEESVRETWDGYPADSPEPGAARRLDFEISITLHWADSEWGFVVDLLRRLLEQAATRYACHDIRVLLKDDYSQLDGYVEIYLYSEKMSGKIHARAPDPGSAYGVRGFLGVHVWTTEAESGKHAPPAKWWEEHTRPYPLDKTLGLWNLRDIPGCNWTGGRSLTAPGRLPCW